ncbi:helix-turn-helix domain-containing protein [Dyadobacter pollutisoli]|uniref:Helix-turn-helix transcriptional regulator n=1 Tax=Dyadobacter pollutisoli TaxID=2910158 RepID=A0A9E8SQP2_9BACT|nr:helix-turn-helix transcriptional regulator [Dyadobacter pollutisoli]WAC13262.1 helix-turn-helix transcriptional regulator [Dyadobacter pollutisoli]
MSAKLNEVDEKLKESIAKRITQLRVASGKRQSQFALENLELEKQVLQRLEAGRGASIYTINKFCKSIGISLSEFFNSEHFS